MRGWSPHVPTFDGFQLAFLPVDKVEIRRAKARTFVISFPHRLPLDISTLLLPLINALYRSNSQIGAIAVVESITSISLSTIRLKALAVKARISPTEGSEMSDVFQSRFLACDLLSTKSNQVNTVVSMLAASKCRFSNC